MPKPDMTNVYCVCIDLDEGSGWLYVLPYLAPRTKSEAIHYSGTKAQCDDYVRRHQSKPMNLRLSQVFRRRRETRAG